MLFVSAHRSSEVWVGIPTMSSTVQSVTLSPRSRVSTIGYILTSPRLAVMYLAGGLRYMGGLSIAAFNPGFFTIIFPSRIVEFSIHNSIAIAVGGSVAQMVCGYISRNYLQGLVLPVFTTMVGGAMTIVLYISEDFTMAVAMVYMIFLIGEGWLSGTITTVQQTLPPGPLRDEGVSIFFAFSMIMGAADVLVMSYQPITEDLPTAEVRRTMLLFVSGAYLLSAVLFLVATLLPSRLAPESALGYLSDSDQEPAFLPDANDPNAQLSDPRL